jgi:uncharacterized membrane protein
MIKESIISLIITVFLVYIFRGFFIESFATTGSWEMKVTCVAMIIICYFISSKTLKYILKKDSDKSE